MDRSSQTIIISIVSFALFFAYLTSNCAAEEVGNVPGNINESMLEQFAPTNISDICDFNLNGNLSLSCTIGENLIGSGVKIMNVTFYLYGDNNSSVYRFIDAFIDDSSVKNYVFNDQAKNTTTVMAIRFITGIDSRKYTDIKESDGVIAFSETESVMKFQLSDASTNPIDGFNDLKPSIDYTSGQIADNNTGAECLAAFKDYQKIFSGQ